MLTSINKILYATDLDTGMRPALRMAMSLADKYQAQVTFLYIIEPVNQSVYHWQSEDFWQEIRGKTQQASVELSEEYLSRFFEEEQLGENVARPRIVIKHGHVADTILQTADDIDADLIIIGVVSDFQLHIFHVKQANKLFGNGIFGFLEDADQCGFIQSFQGSRHRQSADKLRNQAVFDQVIRLQAVKQGQLSVLFFL